MRRSTNGTMSQVEANKAIINRYFEAYNTKNEAIFDEIIAPDCIDHGQSAYMGSPGRGIAGAKNDFKRSLDKLDEFSYVIEAMIASESFPDLVGTYWKGSLTPKASPRMRRTSIK
jgi:SnoaL-like domain